MNEPFVKVELHGLRQEEAIRVIDRALASAGPMTYQLQLIHGYHRGTSLRSMYRMNTGGMRRCCASCPATIPGSRYWC